MFRPLAALSKIVPTVLRAGLVATMLFAPLVAVSYAGDQGFRIEAPTQKKMGAGLVLLISLQRH